MAETARGTAATDTAAETPATVARYGAALVRDRDAQRRLHEAREAYFDGEAFTKAGPSPIPVRNEILGSWRRSRLAELTPDRFDPPYESTEDRATSLKAAARPVIAKLAAELTGTGTSILLTDRHGWIVARWADTPSLAAILDRNRTSPGFSLREDAVGTNGLGSVIESGRPFQVCDAEHFSSQFLGLTCAGAPIRHPINGRLEGVIDITCRFEDTNALLLPLAMRAATDIERLLYARSSATERALLERFLVANRRRGRPVLSLSEDMVIASASATRILGDVDIVSLWEGATAAIRGRYETIELRTKDGTKLLADYQPAFERGELLGTVVHLTPAEEAERASPPRTIANDHSLPGGLVGISPAWQQVVEVANLSASLSFPCLIEGEPGTGKRSVARAIHHLAGSTGPFDVHCGAMAAVEGLATWVERVQARLDDPSGSIMLCHLDSLEPPAIAAITAVIDDLKAPTPRILATCRCSSAVAATDLFPLLNTLGVVRIAVPPLRDRPTDIAKIVQELTVRHGHQRRRWRSDSLQALARHDWPDNVRELERAIQQILLTHQRGDVNVADLPPDILARTKAPFLGELEQAELQVLLNALDRAGGNKTAAAKAIGMARSTLYRKLRDYGVDLDRRWT